MSEQNDKANRFMALHVMGDPVVLFNIWDPGSAGAVAAAGANALATGSWPVAAAHGYPDGEVIPLQLALDNAQRIISAVDLPVSIDLEGCYAIAADGVAETVSSALATGAVGFNFEDQIVGAKGFHPIPDQVLRIEAARASCSAAGVPAFINARTDLFLKTPASEHDSAMLDEALERAKAYEQAGASGFFAPGLSDEVLIQGLCAGTALPVNILARSDGLQKPRLAELGVARISYGPGPYRQMMANLTKAAKLALS